MINHYIDFICKKAEMKRKAVLTTLEMLMSLAYSRNI